MIAYELALRLPYVEPNTYGLHQLIWQQLLSSRNLNYSRSLLFRILEKNGEHFALLRLPSELREYLESDLPAVSVVCPIWTLGQRFLFSVRLCPLYRSEGRYERTPSDLMAWTSALFLRNGLQIEALNTGTLESGFYEKPGMPKIPHNTRLFSVVVTVANVDLAQQAWLYGIGRRKSTGCGMLLEG